MQAETDQAQPHEDEAAWLRDDGGGPAISTIQGDVIDRKARAHSGIPFVRNYEEQPVGAWPWGIG